MHDRWSRYHMSREMPQVSSKACCAATGAGIGDREARFGVRLGLSDPGGSVSAGRASHSGETRMNLIVRLAALIETVRLGDTEGQRSCERILRKIAISMLET